MVTRFRFTTRTLVASISIGCVLLGLEVNRSHNQARVLASVRAAGGRVFYNYSLPRRLAERLGPDFLSRVIAIDMSFTDITDDQLGGLTDKFQKLRSLDWIRLTRTGVTHGAAKRLNRQLANVKVYHAATATHPPLAQSHTEIPVSWGETPLD